MMKKTLTTISCVLILCGLIAAFQPICKAATPTLVGSWQFTLTPTSPASSVTIPGLATFTSDGSTIEADGLEVTPNPSAPNTYSTAGHGIWEVTPSATGFYVQYISIAVNADNSLYAKSVTTMTVTLDAGGTLFSGDYTINTTTASGSTNTVSGTVAARIIPHPTLP
jgi:hypothetical protein